MSVSSKTSGEPYERKTNAFITFSSSLGAVPAPHLPCRLTRPTDKLALRRGPAGRSVRSRPPVAPGRPASAARALHRPARALPSPRSGHRIPEIHNTGQPRRGDTHMCQISSATLRPTSKRHLLAPGCKCECWTRTSLQSSHGRATRAQGRSHPGHTPCQARPCRSGPAAAHLQQPESGSTDPGLPPSRRRQGYGQGVQAEGVDMKTTAMTSRSLAAGVSVSMRAAFPRPPRSAAESWPPTRPVPDGRLAVAVVLGASGSVVTDALGPYEVFARSPRFLLYTVSAGRPTAMLSGGLATVPDYSLEDVDTGSAPAPDVVVIPAVAALNGKKEAPLREWIARQANRGAHFLRVCVDRLVVPGVRRS